MSTNCPRCGGPRPANWPPTRPCPGCLMALGLGTHPENDSDPAPMVFTGRDSDSASAIGPSPTPAELDPLFPELEVLELIGEGGMGAVYRARQIQLDRPVALKVLRPQPDPDGSLGERFLREARSLAKLSHPGIVSIFDVGRAGGRLYLVMELVHGTNLRTLLNGGELNASQCLDLVSQMCAALQVAHEHGVVHRDIKPENVLVDSRGRVKIVDFGLAKVAAQPGAPRLTMTGQSMGTPQYMAPEQIEHPLDVDHRADLYSLGVVIYELFTGELPLGRFDPPSHKPGVDSRLDEVVHRALEKDPERRYQAASEIGTRVEEIRATPEAPPLREAPRPPQPQPRAGKTIPPPPPLPDPTPKGAHRRRDQRGKRTSIGPGCVIALVLGLLFLAALAFAVLFAGVRRVGIVDRGDGVLFDPVRGVEIRLDPQAPDSTRPVPDAPINPAPASDG